jgi:hypothetical protein
MPEMLKLIFVIRFCHFVQGNPVFSWNIWLMCEVHIYPHDDINK